MTVPAGEKKMPMLEKIMSAGTRNLKCTPVDTQQPVDIIENSLYHMEKQSILA